MLTIGQLAEEAGVGVETIRFYEREGLPAVPRRSPSGYRPYPPGAVARVRFLRCARWLGFTLRDAGELLALRDDPDADRADVREKATAKLAAIDERIEELRAMRVDLARLLAACRGNGPAAECPILAPIGEDTHERGCRPEKSETARDGA